MGGLTRRAATKAMNMAPPYQRLCKDHDEKGNRARQDAKGDILLNDHASEPDREVLDLQHRRRGADVMGQIPKAAAQRSNTASRAITPTMPMTTAVVAALPTAAALRSARRPTRQPMTAMNPPKQTRGRIR